ncbi:PAS domain-containing sensor histidine kinase [Massilia niastensis]|uniref:PAS domain-containing sensor histidine kinase n=1 Tax=Massilia niastensis TaxID=544911 RepID=UPI000375BA09|nr:HAMP domain-containing sensor histidine kinase [Massilia niastensis]
MKTTPDVAQLDARSDMGVPAAQFRAIAEIGGDIAFSIALPGCTLSYLSPAFSALLGHDAAVFAAALAARPAQGPLAPLAQRLRTLADGRPGERQAHELEVADAQGRPVPLDLIATVVADETPALVGLLRDQSARHAYQAEQKRFASMLNHEFRTPLATIDGAIQRLEAKADSVDEATRQRYRKIGAAADRLIGMLDEYLSPDRMASIGKTRQPNTISVGELVEGGAVQVRAAQREARVEAGDQALSLRGEPEGLRLALKVLVDNALLFSPAGSPVLLGARRSGGGIEFTVRDGGGGVPLEDAAYIFDKGYRGANAAGLPGSGLGLYMARSIVDIHGGALSLAPSEGRDGGGAEFRLWLPALHGLEKQRLASASPSSDNRPDAAVEDTGQHTNNMAEP